MIFARLIAWLTRGTVVYLFDHDGQITPALAWPTTNGMLRSSRFGKTVLLLPDGSVLGPTYVKRWLPATGGKDILLERRP